MKEASTYSAVYSGIRELKIRSTDFNPNINSLTWEMLISKQYGGTIISPSNNEKGFETVNYSASETDIKDDAVTVDDLWECTKEHLKNEKITHESAIKDVIAIFIDSIAFLDDDEKKTVNKNTHTIKDFKMQDCDFLVFDMDLEKHFSVKLRNEDWEPATHIHEISDLIIKRLNEMPRRRKRHVFYKKPDALVRR